jgi:hypothetical protein
VALPKLIEVVHVPDEVESHALRRLRPRAVGLLTEMTEALIEESETRETERRK